MSASNLLLKIYLLYEEKNPFFFLIYHSIVNAGTQFNLINARVSMENHLKNQHPVCFNT